MTLEIWLLFAGAALVVILIPGPLSLLMISNSLNYGVRRSWPAFLGGVTASIALLSASALGLGALLMASERLFSTLKLVGTLYLFYLAWQSWKEARRTRDRKPRPRPTFQSIVRPGVHPWWQQSKGHSLLCCLSAAVSQRGAAFAAAAVGDDPYLGRARSALQAGLRVGRAGGGTLPAHREGACVVQPDKCGAVWGRGGRFFDEPVR